jgi:hypothetical protein
LPAEVVQYKYLSYWCGNASPLTISVNGKYAAISPYRQRFHGQIR